MKAVALALVFATSSAQAFAEDLQLALPEGESYQLWRIDVEGRVQREPLPESLQSPLGSLWKLFIYDFLVSRKIAEKPYVCAGQNPEEVYCCESGGRIGRDEALIKSCGLYFSPERWNITPQQWAEHWPADRAPPWLHELARLDPNTQVGVQELLEVLGRLPSRAIARRILLDRILGDAPFQIGNGVQSSTSLAGTLGSRLRIKSWSWRKAGAQAQRIGGFAGWLSDGTPVWASGAGTGQQVLQRFAIALNRILPVEALPDPGPCVEVALFKRYPLRTLKETHGDQVTTEGPLNGTYQLEFQNGKHLAIESRGDIFLSLAPDSTETVHGTALPHLLARLNREEYVARVIDREAAPLPEEAAKALAVAARTYLLQSASDADGCLQIDDSSHRQRVAPRPASTAARRIANWTADLVLAGAAVTYRQNPDGAAPFNWETAKQQAARGLRYDAILAQAFPQANLARWDNPKVTCQAVPNAEQWLTKQLPRWRERLYSESGYQETRDFAVCRLLAGKVRVDRSRRRIYVRNLLSLQDRLDLTHEYLHLAFEAHPNGYDERYVENLARYLLLE